MPRKKYLYPLITILALTATIFLYSILRHGTLDEQQIITVPLGMSADHITELLIEKNVISGAYPFKFLFYVTLGELKAGKYMFAEKTSVYRVFRTLTKGRSISMAVTLPEGISIFEATNIINSIDNLTGDKINLDEEGALLADTYHYDYGSSRQKLLNKIQDQLDSMLDELWRQKSPNLPLKNPQQALILASIVEKEAADNSEKKHIAAVFLNRLKKKMYLQADPTVIYAITKGETKMNRKLRKTDLKISSPYNTYNNKGLPPGPICIVGKDAIKAVLQPIQTKNLYFVADGKGKHLFAATLKQHIRNIRISRKNR